MTQMNDPPLSKIELIVLTRLSCSKTPTSEELGRAITGYAPEAQLVRPVLEVVADALSALRRSGLVRPKAKRLTDEGARMLRAIFGVARTPNWEDIRSKHLPAFGLGLAPGSDEARNALRDAGTIGAALLDGRLDDDRAPALSAAADALIAKLLGLPPGPLTLARIRAQVLAREMRSELKRKPKKKIVVKLVTEEALGEASSSRASIAQALGRRGISRIGTSVNSRDPRADQPATSFAPAAPNEPSPRSPSPLSADTLIDLVREALPRIGSDGRFGPEKVFVSALWHRIESDGRLPDLSLDRFKRWLLTANRDQLLDLARADLVGAMDAKLVAESEIRDLGSTFHFVVDRQHTPMGRGFHAR